MLTTKDAKFQEVLHHILPEAKLTERSSVSIFFFVRFRTAPRIASERRGGFRVFRS
jgi:hypothetical protein